MALKIHGTHNIQPGTIENSAFVPNINLGGEPTITSIVVTDSSYVNLDDVAVSTSGGYIKITGTGFNTGCQVVVGAAVATSVTFVSSTEVRAQVPAQSAGTYTVYLTNSDGDVAIIVNGLNYSATPTWITTSPLASQQPNSNISLQLVASSISGDLIYILQAGSTLPSGLTLSSGGLLSGTTPNVTTTTTYNFTVIVIDDENQDTPQAFQITITVIADPYYNFVALHIPGTGTDIANNYTFLDSSNNNFTVTRYGPVTQGTFSPFSQSAWSWRLTGGSGLSVGYQGTLVGPANLVLGTQDFCIEFWFYFTYFPSYSVGLFGNQKDADAGSFAIKVTNSGKVQFSGSPTLTGNTTITFSAWNHVAVCRSGGTLSLFLNGSRNATTTVSGSNNFSSTSIFYIGIQGDLNFGGFISNLRVIKGSTPYSPASFTLTVPSAPLTAVTNTQLLTCNSGYFRDFSSNNYRIQHDPFGYGGYGYMAVPFSPFNSLTSWNRTANLGSAYFSGADGNYLTVPHNAAFEFGTSNFTIELWICPIASFAYSYTDPEDQFTPILIGKTPSALTSAVSKIGWVLTMNNLGTLFRASSGINTQWDIYLSASNDDKHNLNVWSHIAISRNGSNFAMWINGQRAATLTNSASITSSTASLGIGAVTSNSNLNYNGWMSDLRIVKGTAVYDPTSTTITVPTTPLSVISNTSLLVKFNNTDFYDATTKTTLIDVSNVQLSNTTAKFGNTSIKLDGVGSWFYTQGSHELLRVASGNFTIELWAYKTTATNSVALFGTRSGDVGITGTGFNGTVWAIYEPGIEGQIVVGGNFTSYNGISQNYITRLNILDGTRDTSFIIGTGFNNIVYALVIQSDNKIVVGGVFTSYNGTTQNYITRLNSDGTRDTGFSIGTGFNGFVQAIAIQSDGKIVVGGLFSSYNGTTQNNITRLNSDGTRDTGFSIGTGFNYAVRSITIQSDGKIVAGGNFTSYNGTTQNYITRLNSDGTRDTSFTIGTGFNDTVSTVLDRGDGKIIVGGTFTSYNGTTQNRITRLNSNGTRDTDFNIGTGFNGPVNSICWLFGAIIVGGNFTSYNGTTQNYIVSLYNFGGSNDGTISTDFTSGTGFNSEVFSLGKSNRLYPENLFVGGSFTSYNGTTQNRITRLYHGYPYYPLGTIHPSQMRLSAYINSSGLLECYINTDYAICNFTHQTPFPVGAWTHVALVRSGTNFKLYLNGVESTSSSVGSGSISMSTSYYEGFKIGYFVGSSLASWNGHIQDFRITNNYARYTSTFTVPSDLSPTK